MLIKILIINLLVDGMNRHDVFKNLLSYLKFPFSPKTEFCDYCLKRLDEITEKTEGGLEIIYDDDVKHFIK